MDGRPPRTSFVIRGGLFANPEDLLTAVADAYEDGDGAVASVYVGAQQDDESFDDAIRRVCIEGELRHGKIRITSVAALEDVGFSIELDNSDDQPACHHNVVFTEPPNLEQARLFVQCFEPPIPNPGKD